MTKMLLKGIVLQLLATCFVFYISCRSNVEITRYEVCSRKQGAIKFYGHFIKEKHEQYLYFNVTLPFPLGDNAGINITIQTTLTGNTFRTIHTIHDKNMCKMANMYLGDHWYNLTRAAKIPVKTCPIAQGFYQANHVLLNLNTLPLQNFPFGKLRFIMNVVNTSDPIISFLCLLEEVEYVNK